MTEIYAVRHRKPYGFSVSTKSIIFDLMEGDRYGQESMIVRRSISAGTLSLTPSVPDSVPPPEINLLFPEVFTVGSNPAGPTRKVCKRSRDDAELGNAEAFLALPVTCDPLPSRG